MSLFSKSEQRTLGILLGVFLLGLAIGQMRDSLMKTPESDEAAIAAFEEGVTRYMANPVGNSEQGAPLPFDLNQATMEELQVLSGIGPVLAKKIVDYRSENGYFHTVQELQNISGIGPILLSRWENQLIIVQDSSIARGASSE